MRAFPIALTAALIAVCPAAAQTVVTADGSTATAISVTANETTITGGMLAGSNLFHSFGRFDLAQGDIAQWVRGAPDAPSIANVINRVTGGSPSSIDGTLRVKDMPNAAFWFVNPAGIVFGEGAKIDIPGAVRFATAEELHFADGASLSTVTPDGSSFSIAAPEAFGFLGGQGNIIALSDAPGFGSSTTDLAFTAGNILFDLPVELGSLDLTAIGDVAAVVPASAPPTLLGNGRLVIGGGAPSATIEDIPTNLPFDDYLRLLLNFSELDDPLRIDAGRIRMASSSVEVQFADLYSRPELGAAPEINLVTDDLLVSGSIGSETRGGLDGGPVLVTAQVLVMTDGYIGSQTYGAGRAGDVVVTADLIDATRSGIGSSTTNELADAEFAEGSSGDVLVRADTIALRRSSFGTTANFFTSGDAGNVTIEVAGELLLDDFASIDASSEELGDAGNLFVEADRILLLNGAHISSETRKSGAGGDIRINTRQLAIDDGYIATDALTRSIGDAGDIFIDAAEFVSIADGYILAGTRGLGRGGAVTITTPALSLFSGSHISTGSDPSGASDTIAGAAGDIMIKAGSVKLDFSSFIDASGARNRLSSAGSIGIEADSLSLTRGSSIFSTSPTDGEPGSIRLLADSILIRESVVGTINRGGLADAGDIVVEANTVSMEGATVSSGSVGNGAGGAIRLDVGQLSMFKSSLGSSQGTREGTGIGGPITVRAGAIVLDESDIASQTFGLGDAGDIKIEASRLVLDRSAINASTFLSGRGGAIKLDVGMLEVRNFGLIGASSLALASGDSGDIRFVADELLLTSGRNRPHSRPATAVKSPSMPAG